VPAAVPFGEVEETIVYNSAVVTFLDVLGFRTIVAERSAQDVARVLDLLAHFSAAPDPGNPYAPTVTIFSDSVVRVRPIDTGPNKIYPVGILVLEIIDLMRAQGELAASGVLVRGGITVGDIFATPARVFGPALIEAYEIESRVAVHPRLVVSRNALDAHRRMPALVGAQHDLAFEAEELAHLLSEDRRDGTFFVDYLRRFAEEVDDEAYYPEFLNRHRCLIERAAESKPCARIRAKYEWLAGYHNAVVAELTADFLGRWHLTKGNLQVGDPIMELLQSG
jgi:hypothetical protein